MQKKLTAHHGSLNTSRLVKELGESSNIMYSCSLEEAERGIIIPA
jgi:hypothetical protein